MFKINSFSFRIFFVILTSFGVVYAKDVNISIGTTKDITTKKVIKTAFTSDKAILDYKVIDNHHLVLYPLKTGVATYEIYGEDGKTIEKEVVHVVPKFLKYVQQQVNLRYPGSSVTLKKLDKTIVMTGSVPSSQMKNDIDNYVGSILDSADKESKHVTYKISGGKEGAGSTGGVSRLDFLSVNYFNNVLNLLKVSSLKKEINIRVTIASVNKDIDKELGFNWAYILSGGIGTGSDVVRGVIGSASLTAALKFLDEKSVGSILAEPNMTVESGKTGAFHSGGEIPYSTENGIGNTIITYKKYGISLVVAASVEDNGMIDLFVTSGLSSIDKTDYGKGVGAYPLKASSVTSTVQLKDGQSFAIGGLLNRTKIQSLSKVPGLGDIPFFGALFRHMATTTKQQELIIIVTANRVHPQNKISDYQIPSMKLKSTLSSLLDLKTKNQEDVKKTEVNQETYMKEGGFNE